MHLEKKYLIKLMKINQNPIRVMSTPNFHAFIGKSIRMSTGTRTSQIMKKARAQFLRIEKQICLGR